MKDLSPVGKWNPELFARYRAAKPGPVRRALLNELLRINAPLVKTLVDQLCGRGEVKRKAVKLGGCQGFRDIPWDDAYQAGCIAFMKAMDRFNPAKGKLPFYLLMKIRYELQVIVSNELRLARVPRGHEADAVTVDLVGEQRELDEMGGSVEAGRIGDEWEGVEDLGGAVVFGLGDLVGAPDNDIAPRPLPLVRFFEERLVFRSSARVALVPLFAQWEQFSIEVGEMGTASQLREALREKGVRRTSVRVCWAPQTVEGFAGVTLRAAVGL